MNSKNSLAEYSNQVKKMNKPLVVVVLGPTASGKTSLGIEIAEKMWPMPVEDLFFVGKFN